MRLSAVRRAPAGEEGFALVAVLGTMAVLTLFLLATLGYAVHEMPSNRKDQDGKAAVAAAQAGLEDFLSRLNSNGDYWQTVDATNPAFTNAGLPVPGTGGNKASFSYRVLSTLADVGTTGSLRVEVTGRSRGVTRRLTTSLQPVGFLKYVYYTDIEATDPALYSSSVPATVAGETTSNSKGDLTAFPPKVEQLCAQYYYAGRKNPMTYTASAASPYIGTKNGTSKNYADGQTVSFDCAEIQWITGDSVDGPLHSNDALQITGSPVFASEQTESSWPPGSTPAPTPGHLWWGTGAPGATGSPPVYFPAVSLPDTNTKLLDAATANGCVYSGSTRITFGNGSMKVLSPNTTTENRAGCYPAGAASTERIVSPIPPAIFVKGTTGACTPLPGYPMAGEVRLGASPAHVCGAGDAYVSGTIGGRTTLGTANDIVVTGDLKYQNGTTTDSTDVLGLIASNYVWVYHPVDSSGNNLLAAGTEPHTIQAAVLSVAHSFLVQSYAYGASLATGGLKLNVTGSISQKFRGPVGSNGTTPHGYSKNYKYDRRLLRIPPPYFLQPKQAPWLVGRVSG